MLKNLPSVSVALRRGGILDNLSAKVFGSTGDEYSVGVNRGVRGRIEFGADDIKNERPAVNNAVVVPEIGSCPGRR